MTNKEYRKKYPIGTKIRWIFDIRLANSLAKKDIGKVGKIVGYSKRDAPRIFLPESTHLSTDSTQAIPVSWWSSWENLEILLPKKGEQLLFSFMSE